MKVKHVELLFSSASRALPFSVTSPQFEAFGPGWPDWWSSQGHYLSSAGSRKKMGMCQLFWSQGEKITVPLYRVTTPLVVVASPMTSPIRGSCRWYGDQINQRCFPEPGGGYQNRILAPALQQVNFRPFWSFENRYKSLDYHEESKTSTAALQEGWWWNTKSEDRWPVSNLPGLVNVYSLLWKITMLLMGENSLFQWPAIQ